MPYAQHSVHLTGGYAPRFQAFSLAQAHSVKMALSRPSRQQVTQTVSPLFTELCERRFVQTISGLGKGKNLLIFTGKPI